MNQPPSNPASFLDIKHFKLRGAVMIGSSRHIVFKWHDPLSHAFIATCQPKL